MVPLMTNPEHGWQAQLEHAPEYVKWLAGLDVVEQQEVPTGELWENQRVPE